MLQNRKSRSAGTGAVADTALPATDPVSIGAELRQTREAFGWKLADAASALRIKPAHLEALEDGRLADLPGMTYAIGFLKSYASLLRLDPIDYARRLKTNIARESHRPALDFPAPLPERGVPAGAIALLGIVLAIGAYVGWYRLSGE